jgi:archaellum component FlaG (FlaF/FlaG flagellin family)
MISIETNSSTVIYVEPQTSFGAIAQNFTINIDISNVSDLYGWEVKLGWNATVLDVVEVYEGPFLKSTGDTFFTYSVNTTAGYIILDCTLLGLVPGVSGNGTLATVKLYVKNIGDSILDLYDTLLIDSYEQTILHTVIDGYYYNSNTSVHDVSITNLEASQTTVNVTIKNQGTFTETFNVSTYYTLLTDPLIATQTITLEPNANVTLIFTWNPQYYGRYEIQAQADVVTGETNIQDNILTIQIYISFGTNSSLAYSRYY